MQKFSILLIENKISITAQIVSTICWHLNSYALSITRDISEAISNSWISPDLILLDISQLENDLSKLLSSLISAYPHAPILLLTSNPKDEAFLLETLSQGASDYSDLSEAGLLTLGRRLAVWHDNWEKQASQDISTGSHPFYKAISDDVSPFAIQLIDAANYIRAWNRASETLFGVKAETIINHHIDKSPLSMYDISRLKDLLDQAHSTKRPFFLPLYHLEGTQTDTPQKVQAHVYPIYESSQAQDKPTICIVISKQSNLTFNDVENVHYNQELQVLLEASREISHELELQPTLKKVAEQTKSLLHGLNCQIYFLGKDNTTLRPVLAVGPLAEEIQNTPLTMGQGMLGQSAAMGKATIINHITPDSELAYPDRAHILCTPLTTRGGTIGLVVVSRNSFSFTKDDLRFFETLIQHASAAINNARLFEETSRSLNELATLYEASAAISTHWDDQDVLNSLTEKIVQVIGVSRGFIASWVKERNKGFIKAEYIDKNISPDQPTPDQDEGIDLSGQDTLLSMLKQQRLILLDRNKSSLDETQRQEMLQSGKMVKLLIPLVTKNETIGWVELAETRQERTFTPDEVRICRTLANQIAIALQNAQYLKRTQRTLEETTALYRVASELTTLQDSQSIMSVVLQEYLYALNIYQGSIIVFDFSSKSGIVRVNSQDNGSTKTSQSGLYRIAEGQRISLSNNPVYERLMRSRQSVIIDDPQAQWLTELSIPSAGQTIPPLAGWGNEDAVAVLVTPIKSREDIIGALVAEDTRRERTFDRWAVSLGQAMADQLGVGLQNVELYEAEYFRRAQAETLREVSSVVGSSLNLNEVLERILDELGRVVMYDSAAIHLIEGKRRRVIAGRGFKNIEDHIGLSFPIRTDQDEPGSVAINKRQPLVYNDISGINDSFKELRHHHIKSWMGIPLIARDKVIGLITIDHGQLHAYNNDDVELAQAFANQVAIALENARLHNLEVKELERELDFAQEIQETLLPQFIPQIPDLDIAGRNIPARQVGGDFFHFFSTDSDQLGVAIGDVSGKGIPAALYMAAAITAIDIQTGPDVMPGELLNKLNKKLYTRLHENKMNIALQVATFIPLPHPENANEETKKKARGSIMTVASAGMIAPIGATEHGCRFLPVGGFPIGALPAEQHEYFDEVFLLDPFTTIIMTSDGIVEAQNEEGELFGFERLEATILEIVSTRNANSIAEHIVDTAQMFMGRAEQHDDMTVVVVAKI